MKLRHATALALMGVWYLMLPPWGKGTVDTSAPLGQWTVLGTSNAQSDCVRNQDLWRSQSKTTLGEMANKEWQKEHPNENLTYEGREIMIEGIRERINDMRCVSSDDPLLKSN
jgi:hypothetical protein